MFPISAYLLIKIDKLDFPSEILKTGKRGTWRLIMDSLVHPCSLLFVFHLHFSTDGVDSRRLKRCSGCSTDRMWVAKLGHIHHNTQNPTWSKLQSVCEPQCLSCCTCCCMLISTIYSSLFNFIYFLFISMYLFLYIVFMSFFYFFIFIFNLCFLSYLNLSFIFFIYLLFSFLNLFIHLFAYFILFYFIFHFTCCIFSPYSLLCCTISSVWIFNLESSSGESRGTSESVMRRRNIAGHAGDDEIFMQRLSRFPLCLAALHSCLFLVERLHFIRRQKVLPRWCSEALVAAAR